MFKYLQETIFNNRIKTIFFSVILGSYILFQLMGYSIFNKLDSSLEKNNNKMNSSNHIYHK